MLRCDRLQHCHQVKWICYRRYRHRRARLIESHITGYLQWNSGRPDYHRMIRDIDNGHPALSNENQSQGARALLDLIVGN